MGPHLKVVGAHEVLRDAVAEYGVNELAEVLGLLVVAVILYVYSCSNPKDIDPNKKAVEVLQEQIDELKEGQKRLIQKDSTLQADFQQKQKKDSIELSILKKKRDEKVIRIGNSDNDELRRYLAED